MRYLVELGTRPSEVPADLVSHVDMLQEELDELDHIIDPDLLVNLRNGEVVAAMEIEAGDMMEAASIATCALRTALHALGESTPGWERVFDEFSTKTKPADLVEA